MPVVVGVPEIRQASAARPFRPFDLHLADGRDFRYRAFISYSHSDEKWARWLHRALETYGIPKRLIGQKTEMGPVPAKLGSPLKRNPGSNRYCVRSARTSA